MVFRGNTFSSNYQRNPGSAGGGPERLESKALKCSLLKLRALKSAETDGLCLFKGVPTEDLTHFFPERSPGSLPRQKTSLYILGFAGPKPT